jgi:hypothetical protein
MRWRCYYRVDETWYPLVVAVADDGREKVHAGRRKLASTRRVAAPYGDGKGNGVTWGRSGLFRSRYRKKMPRAGGARPGQLRRAGMKVGIGCRLSYLANLMVNNSLMPAQSVLVFQRPR